MQIKTIRRGSSGPLVRKWQDFLRGQDVYLGTTDGRFGPATDKATKRYQTHEGLTVDGIVGNTSWGHAMADGLQLATDTHKGKDGPNWPPPPKGFKQASLASRYKLFGKFNYKPAPTKGNPEGIRILGSWQKNNLTRVTVPQLIGVRGASSKGHVYFHKAAAPQLVALFQAWEDKDLIHLVKAWAGSWVPRFIRGSRSRLSNHAWGTAFDICAPWNGLGRRPALVGETGSVRLLVPLAAEHGLWWGGWWGYPKEGGRSSGGRSSGGRSSGGRSDGMHFECYKITG